ncbi:MAG: CoA-acylating methylmalonate-semialdehyde dehydrogenase [Bacillota bacterium]
MSSIQKLKYFTNGEWKESKTNKYMPVTDSSTGKIIAETPCCTEDEVNEAIESAKAAFPQWAGIPITERVQIMYKFKTLIQQNLDELAKLIATEQGKAMREARGEVLSTIGDIEYAIGSPWLVHGDFAMNVSRGHDITLMREPIGVFAGVSPSNFPSMIPFGWMLPLCITLGNTFVLKAASLVPLTGVRMIELLQEAGLPKGVVNFLTCSRKEAEIVLKHPDIKGVSYVGSTKVGMHIYSTAASHGKRVQALCEAKNHALVLKDCELELTAHRIVTSAFGAAGQRCMALPVVCVEEEIADELVQHMIGFAKELKLGPAYKDCTTLGPVISAEQKKFITDWIDKGVAEGAKLVLDGRSSVVEGFEDGYFVGPTIFDYVRPGMSVGDEEIFGPVLCVKRIKDFEEGLTIANENKLANGSVIFTQNGYYAREFITRTHGGMVGVNVGIPAVAPGFPFSGHKDSFFGDLHAKGKDGIAFYTQVKCVTTKWFSDEDKKALNEVKTVAKCGE